MQWEYKVVYGPDVVKAPFRWFPASKAREYGAQIGAYLNHMTADGWEFMSACPEPILATGIYLFFRRRKAESGMGIGETGIKEL